MGLGDVGLGDVGLGDVGTRGRDKQTIPDICAEFGEYNFRWSRESYYMLESLLVGNSGNGIVSTQGALKLLKKIESQSPRPRPTLSHSLNELWINFFPFFREKVQPSKGTVEVLYCN